MKRIIIILLAIGMLLSFTVLVDAGHGIGYNVHWNHTHYYGHHHGHPGCLPPPVIY
jgi:hypothetical protein